MVGIIVRIIDDVLILQLATLEKCIENICIVPCAFKPFPLLFQAAHACVTNLNDLGLL